MIWQRGCVWHTWITFDKSCSWCKSSVLLELLNQIPPNQKTRYVYLMQFCPRGYWLLPYPLLHHTSKVFLIFPCCDVLPPTPDASLFFLCFIRSFLLLLCQGGFSLRPSLPPFCRLMQNSPLLQCHSWPCWLGFPFYCLCHLNQSYLWATSKIGSNLVYRVLHTTKFGFWKRG